MTTTLLISITAAAAAFALVAIAVAVALHRSRTLSVMHESRPPAEQRRRPRRGPRRDYSALL